MKQLPCSECSYYTRISNECVSCYAHKEIEFYWLSNIDEMLKLCPRGWRAIKDSKGFSYYRDYKQVKHV